VENFELVLTETSSFNYLTISGKFERSIREKSSDLAGGSVP
jgi:hypothetical protein